MYIYLQRKMHGKGHIFHESLDFSRTISKVLILFLKRRPLSQLLILMCAIAKQFRSLHMIKFVLN